MNERTHDWDGGPADEDRDGDASRRAVSAPEPSLSLRPVEPPPATASVQSVWLPRAAGSGAAAVSAPTALWSEPTLPPDPVDAPVEQASAPAGPLQPAPPSRWPELVEPAPPSGAQSREPVPAADVQAGAPPATAPPEWLPIPVDDARPALALPEAEPTREAVEAAPPVHPPATIDDAASASVPRPETGPAVIQATAAPDQPMMPLHRPPGPSQGIAEARAAPAEPSPSDGRREADAQPAPFAVAPAFVRAPAGQSIFPPQRTVAEPARARAPDFTLPLPRAPAAPPRYLRRAARGVALLLLALTGLTLALIVLYRWVDPPLSSLMLGQRLSGEPITQRWVPLERISANLYLATIMSEDGRFCRHRGVDWGELSEAIESARDGVPRGGSTITMQVVKNLFLWPSKSYVRKAIEIPLTYVVEAAWPKRRILEIYLNIAEWGPGVFGAEAAARYHFDKPASQLSPREAALLAVSLPNPFEREAGNPGPGTSRLADNLLARMRIARANAFCVRAR